MEPAVKKKIWNILNCIETGTPFFAYDSITILPDGPDQAKQVTLSVGFTEAGGSLRKVVERYVQKNGKFVNWFAPYKDRIGKRPFLVNDRNFISILVHASKNDPLMREAQDEIYEEVYFKKAMDWCQAEGITTPLGMLVIFDSLLQSGAVFTFLRNRFSERTPAHGGDEKKWIAGYVTARNNWLSTHSNKPVRNSAYRTKTYLQLISKNEWDLKKPVRTLNGCNVA